MAINLQDIRTAVQTYLDTKVTVSISDPVPVTGSQINPNEDFTFKISATNASSSAGGIRLKNVRYYVGVRNPSVVKLIVPSGILGMTARNSYSASGTTLKEGTQVDSMYLFPGSLSGTDLLSLDVGDTDEITVMGKACSGPKGGTTSIDFRIYADIDMDYLFPKDENSSGASKSVTVSG